MPSDYSFYEINITVVAVTFHFETTSSGGIPGRRLRSLGALVQFFFCKTLLGALPFGPMRDTFDFVG